MSAESAAPASALDVSEDSKPDTATVGGGRRRKTNPWLSHVKDTMRKNRGVSFKKILKLAKKTFKKSKSQSQSQSKSQSKSQSHSQSHSQSAGKKKTKRGGSKQQQGGSGVGGGKEGMAAFGENAAPVA
jgi:hypothetical protein